MIPSELNSVAADLPATNDYSIVIITSNKLRHQRFANRLIEEFGDLVITWYECDRSVAPRHAQSVAPSQASLKGQLLRFVRDARPYARQPTRLSQMFAAARMLGFRLRWRKHLDAYAKAEEALFRDEVDRLTEENGRAPERINPLDVNTPEFIAALKERNPYFLLTLAGPLYSKEILSVPRGLPINQHAGHSPVLKGSNTIEWALYRHQIEYVSNTIHVTTTGADSGPILRRSNPCLNPTDNLQTVFCRVVALGTELMVEVIRDIIDGKPVSLFPQPPVIGTTYLGKDMKPHILEALERDIQAGWLQDELARLRDW